MIDKTNYSILVDSNLEKKRKYSKIKEKDIEFPSIYNYKQFKMRNYTVPLLKSICKNFKLKVSGTKPDLQDRIYNYLENSYAAIIIQKNYKQYLIKKYYELIGPGFRDRTICKNETDFFTLELLNDITDSQFFSFKEKDNIWGFNIISIYNLFHKNKNKEVYNPYTRDIIDNNIYHNIKKFIRISNILNKEISITLNNDTSSISLKKNNEIKCLELFQIINELGNYSDYQWFLDLSRLSLVKFIRELVDIWEYRAELSIEKKCQICSPNGNPFRYCDIYRINNINYIQLQKNALLIIKQLITRGISREYSNLGAYYVLGALTLVSDPAAIALPWLYQSVS